MRAEEIWRQPFTVLDGGLSTQLEAAGYDLRDELWTARLLVDAPEAVVAAHRSFVDAGAEVLITASYQASLEGLVRAGCTAGEARAAIVGSTALARAGASPGVIVAASLGPYGAVLGDGSEYRGRYAISDTELGDFHAGRLELLAASEPDLIAIETMPSAREVEIVLRLLAEYPRLRAWVAMTGGDGRHVWAGDSVESVAAVVGANAQVVGIGVNCVAPAIVSTMLRRLRGVSNLPLVAYPNHGRAWDGAEHRWIGDDTEPDLGELVGEWVEIGARLIGGCCGYGSTMVRTLAAIRDGGTRGIDANVDR